LVPEPAAAPELFVPELRFNSFPAGSSYGTLLHDLLQWQAEQGWPAGRVDAVPDPLAFTSPAPLLGLETQAAPALQGEWAVQLARACQRADLAADQHNLLDAWVSQIIMTNWPLALINKTQAAINLEGFGAGHYWPEMGFTLPVQRLGSTWLDQQINQAVWPNMPRAALQPRTLEGLLTGFMDLVFQHEGRYYVLDYKSNRLPDYAPATLKAAMLDHRYDVQAVLYVLALHRLLKCRLPEYDFAQHMGGALYWFVRGVDQPGTGMLALNPPRALIEALDAAISNTLTGALP
jgi:exodeoxyribonuclease V beta subunit